MKIGVSTACFYPMLTEKSFENLAENGFNNFEIFINDESEVQQEILKRLIDVKNNYNIDVVSLHSCYSAYDHFMLFSDYERRLQSGIEKYKRLFYATAQIGGKYLIFHGNKKTKEVSEKNYIDVFHKLCVAAEEQGVKILQENVSTTQCSNLNFMKQLALNLGKEANFTFDIKQAIRSGYDPFEYYQSIKKHVKHIHINDNNNICDCMLPGFGTFDFKMFIKMLKTDGYSGSLIIEVYRNNFKDENQLIKSYKYMQNIIKEN